MYFDNDYTFFVTILKQMKTDTWKRSGCLLQVIAITDGWFSNRRLHYFYRNITHVKQILNLFVCVMRNNEV